MKKDRTKHLLYIGLLLYLVSGCVNPDDPRNSALFQGNRLHIQFTLPESVLKTRAVEAEEGENTINDLTLFFFTPSSNGTGTYAGYYRVPDEDLADENELNATNTFELQVKPENANGISITKAYNILAFANMKGNYLNNMDQEFDNYINEISPMTEQGVKNYTIMIVEGVGTDQDNNTKAMSRNNLPMSASFTKQEKEERVVCDLVRTVARFDVVNSVSGYLLVSASVWNAFPQTTVWETRFLDYSSSHLERYYGIKNDAGYPEIKGGLYAFENASTNPDIKDETTTCIILGFKPDIPQGAISYYRVNITPQMTGQYLLRNNVYQITVSGINGPGAGTEEDAWRNGKMLLDTSINSWDRDEDGLIIRDGDNLLAIPSKRVVFGPEGDSRQYYVYTLGTGTLEMEIISLPEGITAWLGGNGNDLFITAQPYNLDERKGAIELRFAGMKGVMEIIQTGKLNKYLTLEHVNVPDYPAGLEKQNMLLTNPIGVKSSGPWTAEIYNGHFSFEAGQMSTTLTGQDGESISRIYNWEVNPDEKPRLSFVLITLDADPDHYRNVIVLKQVGNGKFTLDPDIETVRFGADGTLLAGTNNYDRFTLTTEQSLSWTIDFINNHMDAFGFELEGITGNTCTGNGTFTVFANGENYTGEHSVQLRITHNGLNARTINLIQASYNMALTPNSITDIPSGGGISRPVVVSSNMDNCTWSAEIVKFNFTNLSDDIPKLVNENGELVSVLNNQTFEKTLRVYMPGIDQHLTADRQPTVEVKVTIDGTPMQCTLYVTQQMVQYVNLHAQTIHTGLANWAARKTTENYKVFGQWADEMININHFGPLVPSGSSSGVYTRSAIDISHQSQSNLIQVGGVYPRIINMNNVHNPGSIDYQYLKNDPHTVLIIYSWDAYKAPFKYLGLENDYNPVKPNGQFDENVPRRIYQGNEKAKRTQLWEYIFNGPFGRVNIDNVVLYPQHYPRYMNCLDKWPDTMIPLIMAPATTSGDPDPDLLLVGIDPANRIIWLGHKDLFGNDGILAQTKNNWDNEDNVKFLRNIIAWMVNVNNYGDAFNNRFKEKSD